AAAGSVVAAEIRVHRLPLHVARTIGRCRDRDGRACHRVGEDDGGCRGGRVGTGCRAARQRHRGQRGGAEVRAAATAGAAGAGADAVIARSVAGADATTAVIAAAATTATTTGDGDDLTAAAAGTRGVVGEARAVSSRSAVRTARPNRF